MGALRSGGRRGAQLGGQEEEKEEESHDGSGKGCAPCRVLDAKRGWGLSMPHALRQLQGCEAVVQDGVDGEAPAADDEAEAVPGFDLPGAKKKKKKEAQGPRRR